MSHHQDNCVVMDKERSCFILQYVYRSQPVNTFAGPVVVIGPLVVTQLVLFNCKTFKREKTFTLNVRYELSEPMWMAAAIMYWRVSGLGLESWMAGQFSAFRQL
jgi:hypothetical protein